MNFVILKIFCGSWRWVVALAIAVLYPAPAQADLWVTGYYPGYESGLMAASNIDLSTITHVIHFALTPNAQGGVDMSSESLSASACTKMVALVHGAGRKVLICVAGAETDFLGASSTANLGLFITNILSVVSTYGYDGVDIDWEPLSSSDATQYANLIHGLRTALGAKLLTVAAPAYQESGDSKTAVFAMFASVQSQLDQINIMTYDLSGPYPGWVTWHNSPIYDGGYRFPSTSGLVPSVMGAVSNYLNNGVLAGKVGVGLPYYGYNWTGGPGLTAPRQSWAATNTPTVTHPGYATIVNNYYQSNRYHWDDAAQAAYLSVTNTPASNDMFISYDDAHSCQTKVSIARNLHLGGLMIWELSLDYTPGNPAGQRTPLTRAVNQSLATPSVAGIQFNAGSINFSFSSLPLGVYRVEWSDNLASPLWNTLTNNVPGTGANVQISDSVTATNAARFYRIQTPP